MSYTTINEWFISNTTLPLGFFIFVALILGIVGYQIYKQRKAEAMFVKEQKKKMELRYPPKQTQTEYPSPPDLNSSKLNEFDKLVIQSEHLGDRMRENMIAKKEQLQDEMNDLSVKYNKAKDICIVFSKKYHELRKEVEDLNKSLGIENEQEDLSG